MALQWKLDEEHSGWWKATVGDAVYWVGEADVEDFDVLFSPIGDFNSAEQLADNVVKTPDEAKAIAERHYAANNPSEGARKPAP